MCMDEAGDALSLGFHRRGPDLLINLEKRPKWGKLYGYNEK